MAEIITTLTECQYACRKLKSNCDALPILGFDCEWVTQWGGQRRKIALLQLSDYTGYCALIRLCKMNGIPNELKALLENRDILKLGVAPSEDARKLLNDYSLFVRGTVDLRHASGVVGRPNNHGLKQMALSELGIVIDESLTMSDWEAQYLTPQQAKYAAMDAIVAIDLFRKFSKMIGGELHANLQRYVDVPY